MMCGIGRVGATCVGVTTIVRQAWGATYVPFPRLSISPLLSPFFPPFVLYLQSQSSPCVRSKGDANKAGTVGLGQCVACVSVASCLCVPIGVYLRPRY